MFDFLLCVVASEDPVRYLVLTKYPLFIISGALRSYSSSVPLLVGSIGKVTQVIGAVVDVQFSVCITILPPFDTVCFDQHLK